MPLPVERLAPGETKDLPLKHLLGTTGLGTFDGTITLSLNFTGQLGDLILATGSVDQTGTYVFEVLPQQTSQSWEKDVPFWSLADGYDSMFSVWNPGTAPEKILFTLTYANRKGHYKLALDLQPGASQVIDIAQLIAAQQPDLEGNVIPRDVRQGSAGFSGMSGMTELIQLVISASMFNVQTATCGLCCTCCSGVSNLSISPNPMTCPYKTSVQAKATAKYLNGTTKDVTNYVTWKSSNTSVVTVNSTGLVTSVGVGKATITADLYAADTLLACGGGCPFATFCATCPVCSPPVINSISPSRGLIGATTSVTISGQGFGTSPSVNAPSGITVTINSASDTQIQASFAVSSSATTGNNAITVTASGETSNSVNFFVQVPTSLSIISPKTGSEGPCNGGAWCGTTVSFTYKVNDQDTPPRPINAVMSFWDSFGTTSPDPLQIDAHGGYLTTCGNNSGPCNQFTLASGQFNEGALGACSTVCLANGSCTTGGPSQVNQTWHIAGYPIVQQISIYCQKVLVNGQ